MDPFISLYPGYWDYSAIQCSHHKEMSLKYQMNTEHYDFAQAWLPTYEVTFSKSSLSGIYPSSCCSVMPISTGSGGCNSVGDNTSMKDKDKDSSHLEQYSSIKFLDRIEMIQRSRKDTLQVHSYFRNCLILYSLMNLLSALVAINTW